MNFILVTKSITQEASGFSEGYAWGDDEILCVLVYHQLYSSAHLICPLFRNAIIVQTVEHGFQ